MKKCVQILFGISLGIFFILAGIFYFHETADEYTPRAEAICDIFTDYEMTTYDNPDSPTGITQEYRWILSDVPKRGGCVMFYSSHQYIEIYIDDTCVYSLFPSEDNTLGKTVGHEWAKAYLYDSDEGKEIRILVHPTYEASIRNELTIYYGNHDTINGHVLKNDLPLIIISLLLIIIGVGFILFGAITSKSHGLDRSVTMLGFFSCFAGLWKITDIGSAPIMFDNPVTLSAVCLMSLSMMLVPYVYFIRSQCMEARHTPWNLLCILCGSSAIITMLLQLTGIADLRESLILCHIMIVTCIVSVSLLIVYEAKKTRFSNRLKLTIACCILCLIGTFIDLISYYVVGTNSNMMYCLLSFLIYVVSMGILTIMDARRLMDWGKYAKRYESLAMHDPLTKLYSRAYYSEYIERHNMKERDSYIIMMDVNNLKQCNDTAGHDQGDLLLQNAAEVISSTFSKYGRCIRTGGDEFCVLLRHIEEKECIRLLAKFDSHLAQFNADHPQGFPVEVAYGYAYFDEQEDYDFADTVRRADKMMYQKKHDMKASTR